MYKHLKFLFINKILILLSYLKFLLLKKYVKNVLFCILDVRPMLIRLLEQDKQKMKRMDHLEDLFFQQQADKKRKDKIIVRNNVRVSYFQNSANYSL